MMVLVEALELELLPRNTSTQLLDGINWLVSSDISGSPQFTFKKPLLILVMARDMLLIMAKPLFYRLLPLIKSINS